MGSKRSLAPSIAARITERHPRATILDVFAGMCAVGSELAPKHPVYTNDAHVFAKTVADALFVLEPFAPTSLHARDELLAAFRKNSNALYEVFRRRLNSERAALSAAKDSKYWKRFLEFNNAELRRRLPHQVKALPSLTEYRANRHKFPYALFSTYYSSAYFGLQQCIEIDSLRYAIDQAAPDAHRAKYLSALLQAASHCAAAPGHFAQYLVPRDRINSRYISRIRQRSIVDRFMEALDTFPRLNCLDRRKNRTFSSDATTLLLSQAAEFPRKNFVIYADPPYSRAQYGRYYHVLETLVLYDYPECSGKGRYRHDRFHTDFSRKERVVAAIDEFIGAAAETGAALYVSYPRNGLLSAAGGSLRDLLARHYEKVELLSRELLQHSTMGGAPGIASQRVLEDVYYGGWK